MLKEVSSVGACYLLYCVDIDIALSVRQRSLSWMRFVQCGTGTKWRDLIGQHCPVLTWTVSSTHFFLGTCKHVNRSLGKSHLQCSRPDSLNGTSYCIWPTENCPDECSSLLVVPLGCPSMILPFYGVKVSSSKAYFFIMCYFMGSAVQAMLSSFFML